MNTRNILKVGSYIPENTSDILQQEQDCCNSSDYRLPTAHVTHQCPSRCMLQVSPSVSYSKPKIERPKTLYNIRISIIHTNKYSNRGCKSDVCCISCGSVGCDQYALFQHIF
jgi:hypothetical protein